MSEYGEFGGEEAGEWQQDQEQQVDQVPLDKAGDTFEDVYRAAFVAFANICKFRHDPDHEFVENPDLIEMSKDDSFEFLHRIGQPDPKGTFTLDDDLYTCNSLYDAICDYGIDTKSKTKEFGTFLTILTVTRSIASTFLSPAARGPKGAMTHILLGDVEGNGKSSIRTHLRTEASPASKAFFDANPQTFFTTQATLELVSAQSKQWCKDILTHTTNILSIGSRQFTGSTFTITFEDPSPTQLTIKFHGQDVDEITRGNIILFLNELSQMVLPHGFDTEWKWAVSFEEILTIPIADLLHTQVSLSLPAIGVKSEHLQALPALAPLSLFDVETFDDLCAKIPGLQDVTNGQLATTIDLRNFVTGVISGLLGGEDKLQSMTLLNLLVEWAPVGFTLLTPFLSHNLTLKDVLSALQSLAALGRLVFARDFNNFTAFSVECASGHGFEFHSENVLKVDAFFKALDRLFAELSAIVDKWEADQAANGQ